MNARKNRRRPNRKYRRWYKFATPQERRRVLFEVMAIRFPQPALYGYGYVNHPAFSMLKRKP
jgi:hypothetical protein